MSSQTVEEWGKVSESGSAQIADLYPILQKLPHFLLPSVAKAKHVHKVGRELYTSHWLKAKQALKDGTGLVSASSYPASFCGTSLFLVWSKRWRYINDCISHASATTFYLPSKAKAFLMKLLVISSDRCLREVPTLLPRRCTPSFKR